ncbi:MAG: hypothetical protein SV686_13985 [Thermodesulfobacteriota bacterium]|nr:hypothetical protein [Thermodesulfobacteriota bacterium]
MNEGYAHKASTSEFMDMVRCVTCRQFSYFSNEKSHNSPHALGKCSGAPWDGNKGQWPMFEHSCRDYVSNSAPEDPAKASG